MYLYFGVLIHTAAKTIITYTHTHTHTNTHTHTHKTTTVTLTVPAHRELTADYRSMVPCFVHK